MKIIMIGFNKLAYMPFAKFYLNHFAKADNEVHLLYWNRDEKEEINLPYNVVLHEFKLYQEDEVAKIKKIKSFIKYRREVKDLLCNNKFDLVIILSTLPGLILNDVLNKYYLNKYIFDYRDVTYERIWIYKRMVEKLVKRSIVTFVSSNAYKINFLNQDNIHTSHNILLESLSHREVRRCTVRDVKPIRIRYWGFIRHEGINKAIINKLGNDNRFEIHYHGREQETAHKLKQYCKECDIENVYFHGEYKPEMRYEIASKTDLLHNLFDNDNTMQPAMANKFYDGITFYIPQLCNVGSYMADQVKKAKVGFECNPYSQSFADDIFKYYNSISWNEFEEKCNSKLDEVLAEYQQGINVIRNIEINENS